MKKQKRKSSIRKFISFMDKPCSIAFLKRVEKLIHGFEVDQWEKNLIEWLKFVKSEWQCDRVTWFAAGYLHKSLRETSDDVTALRLENFLGVVEIKSFPQSQKGPTKRKKLLKSMLKHSGIEDWEKEESEIRSSGQTSSKDHWICWPITSPKDGKILGHLVLEGASKKASIEAYEFMNRWVGREIDQCLLFEIERQRSFRDHLTNLYNQKYLPVVLDREIHRATRYSSPFSVLFMDVDSFKAVNDGHGHLAGSKILCQMADQLRELVRQSDYCFRFGGDEFIVVLVETGPQEAQHVAERIRETIEKHVFDVDGEGFKVTVSIGVASCPDHAQTAEQILSMADEAMYYGKRTTKNVVFIAS